MTHTIPVKRASHGGTNKNSSPPGRSDMWAGKVTSVWKGARCPQFCVQVAK